MFVLTSKSTPGAPQAPRQQHKHLGRAGRHGRCLGKVSRKADRKSPKASLVCSLSHYQNGGRSMTPTEKRFREGNGDPHPVRVAIAGGGNPSRSATTPAMPHI